ncbi:hypothetical protein D3C74_260290 [compost metagenome]
MPVGTWTSPGDFGERQGKLTSEKWKGGTQYGQLTEWRVTPEGSFVNGVSAGPTAISGLGLAFNEPIRVRFEVREDAANPRGLNLFGSGFGDYPQDIVLSFTRRT